MSRTSRENGPKGTEGDSDLPNMAETDKEEAFNVLEHHHKEDYDNILVLQSVKSKKKFDITQDNKAKLRSF